MDNNSGIFPVGFSCLILPDDIEEKTESGIIIGTPGDIERQQLGQTDGVLIAIGPLAWYDERGPRAKVGDRVIFAKYAGMMRKGIDGLTYRLINDKELVAILAENKNVPKM